MTIQIDQIEALLLSRGYRVIHETSKKRGFRLGQQLPVYLNLKSKTGETALIAHPEFGIDTLRDQRPDLRVGSDYFHSSNMVQFPKRIHGGAQPISYGWGLTFESLLAIEACLFHLENKLGAIPTLDKEGPHAEVSPTKLPLGADLPTITSRRSGHDQFRDALLDYWRGCAITGLTTPRLLRASHIKPWASAEPDEKTDLFNGLLLAPHFDAAFDAGLIGFNDEGQLLLSPELSPEDASRLGIRTGLRLSRVDARHRPYLAFHRQEIFVR